MSTLKTMLLTGILGIGVACQPSGPPPVVKTAQQPHAPPPPAPAREPSRDAPPNSIAGATRPFPTIESTSLGNGLAIDVIERHAMPVVHLSLIVASGHAQDGDHPGVARVLAQLLEAGGAGRWTSEKLRETVDGLGASLDISSTRDNLRWSLDVTSDKVPNALEILAALAQKPRFDRTEYSKLKERELERIRSLAKTSGAWLAQYWLHRELYRQPMGIHPYASVDVLPSELDRLTLADCRRFFRQHFVPSSARVIAIGDVNLGTLTKQIDHAFGRWSGKASASPGLAEPSPTEKLRLFVLDRPGSAQSDIQLGLLGPNRNSPDFVPIMAIQQIVGGGVAGRLFLDVREKRSLAYSTYAGMQEVASGPSVLTLSAGTQTARTAETISALLEHLDRMSTDPGNAEELETAQSYIIRGMPARWETVQSLAGQLMLLRTLGQEDRHFDQLREQVASLSIPLLKEPAARIYQRQHAVVVVAGDAEKIAESLRQFGPVVVLDPEREFSIKRSLQTR